AAKSKYSAVSSVRGFRHIQCQAICGQERAQEVHRRLAPTVEVMIGNEEDFTAALGFEVPEVDADLTALPVAGFQRMIEEATEAYPNFQVVATTLRAVRTATVNDWGAIAWSKQTGFV